MSVRCFTCNKQLGHLHSRFEALHQGRAECGTIMDALDIKRMCCRRMMLSHTNIVEDLLQYSQVDRVLDESKTTFKGFVAGQRSCSCD